MKILKTIPAFYTAALLTLSVLIIDRIINYITFFIPLIRTLYKTGFVVSLGYLLMPPLIAWLSVWISIKYIIRPLFTVPKPKKLLLLFLLCVIPLDIIINIVPQIEG